MADACGCCCDFGGVAAFDNVCSIVFVEVGSLLELASLSLNLSFRIAKISYSVLLTRSFAMFSRFVGLAFVWILLMYLFVSLKKILNLHNVLEVSGTIFVSRAMITVAIRTFLLDLF